MKTSLTMEQATLPKMVEFSILTINLDSQAECDDSIQFFPAVEST